MAVLCWFVGEDTFLRLLGRFGPEEQLCCEMEACVVWHHVGSVEVAALVVDNGSCMITAGFAGDDAFLLC